MTTKRCTLLAVLVCLFSVAAFADEPIEEMEPVPDESVKIVGQVLWADGTAFAQRATAAPEDSSLMGYERSLARRSATADEDGRFEIVGLAAGKNRLSVVGEDDDGVTIVLDLLPGEVRDMGTTFLPIYVDQSGYVGSADGPLTEVYVRASVEFEELDPRPTLKGLLHAGQVYDRWAGTPTYADDNGRFIVAAPSGLPYQILAAREGLEPKVVAFETPPGSADPVEIVLGQGGGVEVVTLGPDGQPAKHVTVLLSRVEKGGDHRDAGIGLSDDEGRVQFVNLMPGVYTAFCTGESKRGWRSFEMKKGENAEVELKDCETRTLGER